MKTRFLVFFILLTTHLVAQNNLDHGIDTARNREWHIMPSYSISAEPILVRYESEFIKSDQLVILNCNDSTLIVSKRILYPEECIYLLKNKQKSEYLKCEEKYFSDLSNNFNSDTLFIESENILTRDSQKSEDFYFLTKMELYNSDSSYHVISELYTIDEIKHFCQINEGNFRRKKVESWIYGLKDGDWQYYDKTGKLTQLSVYKNGILVKETFY